MSLSVVISFWAVALLFILTPGADWAYAIAAGVHHRTVYPGIAGILAGHLLVAIAVAAGVAAVVAGSPIVLTILTVAGAVYLVWLGVGSLRQTVTLESQAVEGASSPWRRMIKGVGISSLNPKVLLLFLALLPQFTSPAARWPIGFQLLGLGLIHVASCAVVYTGVGMGARAVLRARPAAARIVTRISGVAMTTIGIVLIVERVAA